MLPEQQKINQIPSVLNQQSLGQTVLDVSQLALLQQLTASYSPLQLAWSSGYLAAKSEQSSSAVLPVPQAQTASTLTIIYASQTGNAKGVASN